MSKEQIRELLSIDPLQVAEDLTGKSYKDDEQTANVGVAIALLYSQHKNAVLLAHDDTTISNKVSRYNMILGSMGFKEVLKMPFENREQKQEHLFVFAHPETGVIISYDTFCGDHVNGGHMYYCLHKKPDAPDKAFYGATSAGSWESESEPDWRQSYETGSPKDLYWKGNHDCREAIRYHYNRLGEVFDFINPWPKNPRHSWCDLKLLHHMDWRYIEASEKEGMKHDASSAWLDSMNSSRIELLPDWVRRIINV